ncbi:hypothetical protein ACWGUP_02560 [Streptomyces diastaticus]|uniref:Uncharacterized protein n=3 Tax=Streptomyces TaxID=1883 RepID=A0A380P5L7_STRGR|nr:MULTISPECIES: hypothetical protein [Streptomyces]MBL3803645.1 hypothetical protein [Streptomyces sp. BRB081]NEC15744.1 hypothetical protein [Streptomyces sp. SID8014]QNE83926.1 hypothetical protein F0345_24800 [Streptomyces rutgersensis]RPK87402.1 hypothetical protein EES47_17395 [Streptomyces sp. ADI98-12]SUP60094.1 Uncharacterised protein [Streptomyces griseus]
MTDPNFSGINPDNLMKTITSLVSGSKTLQQGKNSYIGRFRKFGLETTHLTELGKIASWVDDELPMLRRRQTLAAAMEFEGVGPKPPMVQLREPVWTVKQAHAEGKKLAEEAEGLAEMGPDEAGPAFHRIAQELAKHGKDPDFASAFYANMDPEVVNNLPVAIAAAGAPTAKEDAKIFGTAFTAAVSAEKPAPGFHKILDMFHGDLPEDEPGALFNRALMQNDDPDLWETGWKHLQKAITDLGDPKATWTVHAGLVAGVIGIQSNLADKFWNEAGKFSQAAKAAYDRRINAMTPADRAKFKKETRANAKASKAASRQAERLFAKYGMGSFSRLMELSVGDSARWLADKVPYIKAPAGAVKGGWMGKAFRAGGRVPLVGSLLTIGGIAYDIKVNGADTDVAVASNVASLGAGMAGTWAGVAGVAALGGPVGWGVAAGIVVGAGLGYAAYYALNTDTGKKAVKAVTNTAKDIGKGVAGAAKKVGGWLGF